ncbi:MAG: DNA primase [Phototrophicaceae bacterium]|jgi:DNA primase
MSVSDDIKSRLDIVDYVGKFVPLKKSGRYHKAPCPFHQEKTPSFVVNEDHQTWRCFGACAEGGDLFTFAMKLHGWSFNDALQELGALAGVEVRPQTPADKQAGERNERLLGIVKEAAQAYHHKLFDPNDSGAAEALRYAREKRGMTEATLRTFQIGYAPPGYDLMFNHLHELGYDEESILLTGIAGKNDSGRVYDRFRNRLMVPIRDRQGAIVGFGGRILDPNDNPKYLNSPETPLFNKSHLLFGLDMAARAIRDSETAVIVEGYMDAITAHQAGYTNVVAQMGTALTEAQLKLIAPKWAKRIVLALDSDAAGQSATKRSLEVVRATLQENPAERIKLDLRVLHIPNAKDPDDLIRETPHEWERLIAEAVPMADYLIAAETADLPPEATIQEREAAARRIIPLLLATEDSLYRQTNVQKLAMRLHIPERELLQIAAMIQKEAQARPARRVIPAPPKTASPAEAPAPIIGYDEPPPRNYDNEVPPPSDYPDSPIPEAESSAQPSRTIPALGQRSAALSPMMTAQWQAEAHLLLNLLDIPNLYYKINGKLRELGVQQPELAGVLTPLRGEDFTHTGMRGLLALFIESLYQDDLPVSDYVAASASGDLQDALTFVMVNALTVKLKDPSKVGQRDLMQVHDQIRRSGGGAKPEHDIVAQGIRLRARRLMREREELLLMQRGAQAEGDHDLIGHCTEQLPRLARAVHVLATEEQALQRLL